MPSKETKYQETMLTTTEVAKYLHVAPLTIYRMIDRGDLLATKVGRVWRIRAQDLQLYLDRSTNRREAKP